MATETRVHIVDDKHLVRAANASQALRSVVHKQHTVRMASQDDILKIAGLKVELSHVEVGGDE